MLALQKWIYENYDVEIHEHCKFERQRKVEARERRERGEPEIERASLKLPKKEQVTNIPAGAVSRLEYLKQLHGA